jgi:hypothetical protein
MSAKNGKRMKSKPFQTPTISDVPLLVGYLIDSFEYQRARKEARRRFVNRLKRLFGFRPPVICIDGKMQGSERL